MTTRPFLRVLRRAVPAVLLCLAASPARPGGTEVTLTGRLSDATCGARRHSEEPTNCVRACAGESIEYALVVDSRVYTLIGEDDVKDELFRLAAQMVVITGDQRPGSVVAVASVRLAP